MSQNQEIQLLPEVAAHPGVGGSIEQLSQAENLLPQFHFQREAIGVLQDLVDEAKIFRDRLSSSS